MIEQETFMAGPITPLVIAGIIQQHSIETGIGGHNIFLGQVRSDIIEGKGVTAIEYSTYQAMAQQAVDTIKDSITAKYTLISIHIVHSLGIVSAGEICLMVLTSAKHRKAAINSCEEAVERVKAEVPIWGKELFKDDSYQWKVNR